LGPPDSLLRFKFQFIALLDMGNLLRFRLDSGHLMGIATPACGLVRDDSVLITARQIPI